MTFPRVQLGTLVPRDPHRRLDGHEVQQLAYHVGASALGDPIPSPERLAAAAQTVHDVRTLLKHGRGNVVADTAPSLGQNHIGSSVAEGGMNYEYKAVYAIRMGAGVCDRHAGLVNMVHAPHMGADETVASTEGRVALQEVGDDGAHHPVNAGHRWGELRKGGARNGDTTVVMDAWANGPAVRLKDSAWHTSQGVSDAFVMNKQTATFYKERVEGLLPLVHQDDDPVLAGRLSRAKENPTQWETYAEAQVVSRDFASQARTALSHLPSDQQTQLVTQLAQDTYGLSPSTASSPRMVNDVLREARRLDQQGRPPIEPGSGF